MIEANFEIAFNLIDLGQTEIDESDAAWAARAVRDAEDVLRDIERRLELLGTVNRQPFDPLFGELKRQIARAKLRAS
ncbi:MAG TPA: hypothetical protein VGL72_21255 [Bryobacteraceae bacterium]|jgi:hypothetical protein